MGRIRRSGSFVGRRSRSFVPPQMVSVRYRSTRGSKPRAAPQEPGCRWGEHQQSLDPSGAHRPGRRGRHSRRGVERPGGGARCSSPNRFARIWSLRATLTQKYVSDRRDAPWTLVQVCGNWFGKSLHPPCGMVHDPRDHAAQAPWNGSGERSFRAEGSTRQPLKSFDVTGPGFLHHVSG